MPLSASASTVCSKSLHSSRASPGARPGPRESRSLPPRSGSRAGSGSRAAGMDRK